MTANTELIRALESGGALVLVVPSERLAALVGTLVALAPEPERPEPEPEPSERVMAAASDVLARIGPDISESALGRSMAQALGISLDPGQSPVDAGMVRDVAAFVKRGDIENRIRPAMTVLAALAETDTIQRSRILSWLDYSGTTSFGTMLGWLYQWASRVDAKPIVKTPWMSAYEHATRGASILAGNVMAMTGDVRISDITGMMLGLLGFEHDRAAELTLDRAHRIAGHVANGPGELQERCEMSLAAMACLGSGNERYASDIIHDFRAEPGISSDELINWLIDPSA